MLTPKGEAADNPELVTGEWVMRCEARTLDDIRALGGNDLADERRFEAAARVSEINLALYRAFVQPWVKAAVTPPMAEAMRRMHPLRLSYEMFGPRNPFLAWVGGAAEQVRARRQPVRSDNPLLAAQEQVSQQIVDGLEAWRKAMEKALRGDLPRGLWRAGAAGGARHRHELSTSRRARRRRACCTRRWSRSASPSSARAHGPRRAARGAGSGRCSMSGWRAARSTSAASRRSAGSAARIRTTAQMTLAEFKALIREQYYMLMIDEEAALAAIPGLLPDSVDERRAGFATLREVLGASGALERSGDRAARSGGGALRARHRACDLRPAQRGGGRKAS